jgi:hypothetical protein
MSKVVRTTIVAVVAVILLAGGAAAWAAYAWTHHSSITVVSAKATEPGVMVTGAVTGLTPGKTAPLRVVIRNDNDFPVKVTKIAGGSAATTSGCPAWAVRVTPETASAYAVKIPAQSSRTVRVMVGMESWADQKCAGQSFAFDLTTFMTAA